MIGFFVSEPVSLFLIYHFSTALVQRYALVILPSARDLKIPDRHRLKNIAEGRRKREEGRGRKEKTRSNIQQGFQQLRTVQSSAAVAIKAKQIPFRVQDARNDFWQKSMILRIYATFPTNWSSIAPFLSFHPKVEIGGCWATASPSWISETWDNSKIINTDS